MSGPLSDADLAYAAALIDAFGRLTLRSYRGTQLPEVIIQGRIGALPWLAEVTGTKVIEVPKAYNAHRCAEHRTEKHMHVESMTRRWSVTGARATIVLHSVEPFMRVQDRDARGLVEAGCRIGYKRTVVDELCGMGWVAPELRAAAWAPVVVGTAWLAGLTEENGCAAASGMPSVVPVRDDHHLDSDQEA